MAALPYRPVTWGEEVVSMDKLNQMANNEQWLYENTPRMAYKAYSLWKFSGVKVLGTHVLIGGTTAITNATNLYFGSFFSSGCSPIVVATPVPTGSQRRFFVAVNGIGRTTPDHNGCTIRITADELNTTYNRIGAGVYVHVVAIGW